MRVIMESENSIKVGSLCGTCSLGMWLTKWQQGTMIAQERWWSFWQISMHPSVCSIYEMTFCARSLMVCYSSQFSLYLILFPSASLMIECLRFIFVLPQLESFVNWCSYEVRSKESWRGLLWCKDPRLGGQWGVRGKASSMRTTIAPEVVDFLFVPLD